MSPNDTTESEDFVLVDGCPYDPTLQNASNATVDSPVETDYVTVNFETPEISRSQSNAVAPKQVDLKHPLLHIDGFAPMPFNGFSQELTRHGLVGPEYDKGLAQDDQGHSPFSSANAPRALIENASLLFKCFIHFNETYDKVSRKSFLLMIGQACLLKFDVSNPIEDRVSFTFDMFSKARVEFLRTNAGKWKPGTEPPTVEKLVKRVDQYIALDHTEARQPLQGWYKDPAFKALWSKWQGKLKKIRFEKGLVHRYRIEAANHSVLYPSEHTCTNPRMGVPMATAAFDNALMILVNVARSDNLTEEEGQAIQKAFEKANFLNNLIKRRL